MDEKENENEKNRIFPGGESRDKIPSPDAKRADARARERERERGKGTSPLLTVEIMAGKNTDIERRICTG